jgi:hypothetical protein
VKSQFDGSTFSEALLLLKKIATDSCKADPRRGVQLAVAHVIMYRHLSYDRAGSQSDVIDADAALTADRRAPGVLEARDRNRLRGANKWFVEIEITSESSGTQTRACNTVCRHFAYA